MKREYWEKIAPSYGDEIFDVLHNDKKALIRAVIKKYASKNKTVIDIGCAIGKWLPVLSPIFKKVIALDISAKNLEIASRLHPGLKNIQYLRADMSGKTTKLPACDFGICINAILTPSQKDRDIFFKGITQCIKKNGRLVITVPSMESWLFVNIIQQRWKIDRSFFPPLKNSKAGLVKWHNLLAGNADIDDVPHKHFLKEELQLILSQEGFVAEEVQKIEYEWATEFVNSPDWLKEPRPWDWMVVAKRI